MSNADEKKTQGSTERTEPVHHAHVREVFRRMEAGDTIEDYLAEHPELDREEIHAYFERVREELRNRAA
jgi:uncharacterized protein (DUF433 family)